MNNAPTAGGRGTEGPHEPEPFFPSEGTFHPVVPLSEVGRETRPAPLPTVKAADAGKPAEASWAREAHRAALKDEEEATLVPKRRSGARGAGRSWFAPAVVIALSVLAGLASGTYLIRSTQRGAGAQPPAPVQSPAQAAAGAPSLPPASEATPAPVAEAVVAETKVEKVKEAAAEDKSGEGESGEVANAEKPREGARPAATVESPSPRPAPPARAERPARAASEAREVAPAPKPSRGESAPPARTRATAAAKRPPAPSARALPVSDPPPSSKSRKVIQWP